MNGILLAVAAILLAISALLLFDVVHASHPLGWLAAGLFCWCLAHFAGAAGVFLTRNQ